MLTFVTFINYFLSLTELQTLSGGTSYYFNISFLSYSKSAYCLLVFMTQKYHTQNEVS